MANIVFDYAIYLSNPDSVAYYQSAFPSGLNISPNAAATLVGGTLDLGGNPPWVSTQGQGHGVLSPFVQSVTIPAGSTVDSFGIQYTLAGAPGGILSWRGNFLQQGASGIPPSAEPIQFRRWACGFELPDKGDGPAISAASATMSRDASRTQDGYGFAYRSESNNPYTFETQPGGLPDSWERLYLRPKRLPISNNEYFWYCTQSGTFGGTPFTLALTPAGTIAVYALGGAVFPGNLIGSFPVDLNTWIKLDLLIHMPNLTAPYDARIDVYMNGTRQTGGTIAITTSNSMHLRSSIGNQNWVAATEAEIDFDDWTNCNRPTLFNGIDWLNGSHITHIRPIAFDTDHSVNWTGAVQRLDNTPCDTGDLSVPVSTTLSPSPLVVTTNYDQVIRQLGCASMRVALYTSQGAGNNQLGWKINGGAPTLTPITTSNNSWSTVQYSSQSVTPSPITTLSLYYNKIDGPGTYDILNLQASAEFIGTWGSEDFNPGDTASILPPRIGIHNAPYSFNISKGPIAAPVTLVSGTYVGNGTGQSILVTQPIHWWFVRPVGGTQGSYWFSSLMCGHGWDNGHIRPLRFVNILPRTSDGSYNISIAGSAPSVNQNGVTYQWVGFSDPGMRFLLNGATRYSTTTRAVALADPLFTPELALLASEISGSTTGSLYLKGPGHATDTANIMVGTSVSTGIATLGAGNITTAASINHGHYQLGLAAWRHSDGVVTGPVAIATYTGNGGGARSITLDLAGRFPHFVIVQPHNDIAYFRDPSHTTTQSGGFDGTTVSTAITGGAANTITVGTTLNVNAIVYEVLALTGDTTGSGSGGWSSNPTPGTPIIVVDTITRPGLGPWAPTDTKGWWMSSAEFGGSVNTITTPLNPKHPRTWSKLSAFATGASGMLGGSPGAGLTFRNHLIYAGDDYIVGTNEPPIRIFDGNSDRLMQTVSSVAGVPPKAIVSMILAGEIVYLSTLDSGTSASDYRGRVLAFDPLSQNLTPVGAQFAAGEVPYALVWHMGRLWCGTNKANGAAGKLYFFRPESDLVWTQAYDLSTSTAGGVCSLASYNGKLYIGCDAASGFAKLVVRDSLGVFSTTLTSSGGSAVANNGFLSLHVYGGNLYAGYWNNDTTAIAKVYKFDDTTWTTPYSGSVDTLRPYIGMFTSDRALFVVGGGLSLAASLISSLDGTTWTNLTTYLGGLPTETALPIFGQVAI